MDFPIDFTTGFLHYSTLASGLAAAASPLENCYTFPSDVS